MALFERLLGLRNDVGLLSEEWDPRAGRQLGNTPQAFSHFAVVVSGLQLATARAPAQPPGAAGPLRTLTGRPDGSAGRAGRLEPAALAGR